MRVNRKPLIKFLVFFFLLSFLVFPSDVQAVDDWLIYPHIDNPPKWAHNKDWKITWSNKLTPTYVDIRYSTDQAGTDGTYTEFASNIAFSSYYYRWKVNDVVPHPTVTHGMKLWIKLAEGGQSAYGRDVGYAIIDAQAPSSPVNLRIYEDQTKSNLLDASKWYAYENPCFVWNECATSDFDHYNIYYASVSEYIPEEDDFDDYGVTTEVSKSITHTGKYKLFISTEDDAESVSKHPGNVSNSISITYNLDKINPDAQLDDLPEYVNSPNITISGSGSDNDSGLKEFKIYHKTPAMSVFELWKTVAVNAKTGSFSEIYSGFQEGDYIEIKLVAVDNTLPNGNESNELIQQFTVDLIAPTSQMLSPTGTINESQPKVYWSGNDVTSSIDEYVVEYKDVTDNTNWEFFYRGNQTSYTFYSASEGHTYQFRCKAIDEAGNQENWPADYDIEFTVVSNAYLTVNPSILEFNAQVEQTGINPKTIALTNVGGANLNWTASADNSWVFLNLASGSLDPGDSANLNVSLNISGLSAGVHNALIIITPEGESVHLVSITLTLTEIPPEFSVNNYYPLSGPVGISVRFYGVNFSNNMIVKFGDYIAPIISFDKKSPDKLVAIVPNELEEGETCDITLINANDCIVNAGTFQVIGSVNLSQNLNRPNPFNSDFGTTIEYFLTKDSDVNLTIYNSQAKKVWQKNFSAGENGGSGSIKNQVFWDAKNGFNRIVPNGPYFYFIIIDNKVVGKGNMMVIK